MTIQEAIKLLQQDLAGSGAVALEDFHQAEQLLIEAGKRVKWHKEQHLDGFYELLPGETEE